MISLAPAEYGDGDVLKGRSKDYLAVTNEEMFPLLCGRDLKKENGSFQREYIAWARDNMDSYLPPVEKVPRPSKDGKFTTVRIREEQDAGISRLWGELSAWLIKRLRSGTVDSLPPPVLPLFTITYTATGTFYEPEVGDYVKSSSSNDLKFNINYFNEMDKVLKNVEAHWDKNGRPVPGSCYFYQLLWPVYGVGHPHKLKEAGRKPLKWLGGLLVCLGLILAVKGLDLVIQPHLEGILKLLGTVVALAGLAVGLGAVVYAIGFLGSIPLFFQKVTSNSRKLRKLARQNAPDLYRQIQFYSLWNHNHSAVNKLKKIFDAYFDIAEADN